MKPITEREVLEMIKDTNNLIKEEKIAMTTSIIGAYKESTGLANNVEFWRWMGRNYKDFASAETIQKAAETKSFWVNTQLQGKGYEHDFMCEERSLIKNIFSRFSAGDCPTQPGTDITKYSVFKNKVKECFQNKAYVTKTNNPDLHNTAKNVTVVTNTEKVANVKKQGYEIREFHNADKITSQRDKRFKDAKSGKANANYNFKNVGNTMAKAGFVGFIGGITTESIGSYKQWKNGEITGKEYLKEIAKAGGDSGVTGGLTSGIMIPVAAKLTVAGASSLFAIPIGYVVGEAINRVVAPCFARGKYKEILEEAKYYQDLESTYSAFISTVEKASVEYEKYISAMKNHKEEYKKLEKREQEVNNWLKSVYDSI